jgi:hypothetical protein
MRPEHRLPESNLLPWWLPATQKNLSEIQKDLAVACKQREAVSSVWTLRANNRRDLALLPLLVAAESLKETFSKNGRRTWASLLSIVEDVRKCELCVVSSATLSVFLIVERP